MNKIEAINILGGGLTTTSKMPCKSFNLPAWECKTGSKLAKVKGTVCYDCYAMKGNYQRFPAIKQGQYKRLDALFNAGWVDVMVSIIEREKNNYFRWHDAGDIQSKNHFKNICDVAKKTPHILHWIPTREHKIVNDFVKDGNTIPENLIVRISATKVDGKPPSNAMHTSTVHKDKKAIGFECPSSLQGGKCQDCRACWNTNIKNISYKKH